MPEQKAKQIIELAKLIPAERLDAAIDYIVNGTKLSGDEEQKFRGVIKEIYNMDVTK